MQETIINKVSVVPISQHFIEELGIVELFSSYLPRGREEISHGEVINVLLLNLLSNPSPLYKVSEWLSSYSDGIGELASVAPKFHDKRLGESLDVLYQANRAGLLTELSTRVIERHQLETEVIHNDTTSITFLGNYAQDQASGSDVVITHGYNKDHRPDCKQIVFGLNVSADGYVPLSGQLYSGNTSDETTHQANWDGLRSLLDKTDFTYVADSKLSSTENLSYIADLGGYFISVLPATRKEVKDFRQSLRAIPPTDTSGLLPTQWPVVYEVESSRKKGKYHTYRLIEGDTSKEGFRILWIHSSAKAELDREKRQKVIETAEAFLAQLKLNRYYLKTAQQIHAAIEKGLGKASMFFDIELTESQHVERIKIGRGRPGPNSQWEERIITNYQITYSLKQQVIEAQANVDGIFPLISNQNWPAVEILKTYKNQPYLEKRFNGLKSVLKVAPIFLEKPERIEAMLFLYIIALILITLIERRIHKNMRQQQIKELPILPQAMKTKKPTWENLKFCFNQVILVTLYLEALNNEQQHLKGLRKQQLQVLKLLDIPQKYFARFSPKNWKTWLLGGNKILYN